MLYLLHYFRNIRRSGSYVPQEQLKIKCMPFARQLLRFTVIQGNILLLRRTEIRKCQKQDRLLGRQ